MIAYLRVVAGFFAAMFTWMAVEGLVIGPAGNAVVGIALAAGLWYFAIGSPLRRRRAQIAAHHAALAARADAGHAAYVAGNLDPYSPPPTPEPLPRMRTGVKIAAGIAAGFITLTLLANLAGGDTSASSRSPGPDPTPTAPPQTPATAAGAAQAFRAADDTTGRTDTGVPSAGAVAVPDLTGRNAAIAADELADLGLNKVVFRSGNPNYGTVLAPENWTVTGVEPAIGTPVAPDDTIVVTVTKP